MIRHLLKVSIWLLSACAAVSASAQAWPSAKPIRIEIAFGPGSASDIFARMIGDPLSKALGQSVIVESKPGASGQIAAEYVARSAPDGYTLFLTTNTTHSANPYLFKKLSYDPIKDFTPIVRVGYFPFLLLVDSKLPINNVQELITYGKANPQVISYAYTSSAGQVAAAALSNSTRMGAVGVAYKSAPEAMTSVAGGQVTFTVLDFATSQALVKSGRLRALAVSPATRTSLAPTLPTIGEAAGLPEFGVVAWQGLFGPANMPPAIVDRLSTEIQKILAPKEMQERLLSMGVEPAAAGPEEFQRFVQKELSIWERQIKLAGMKPE
ncbi:MAG: transporter substrate-binding protein [Polaromonas sp.]|nr:transporter substrate-binding protein [Polaromonas sp.]